MKDYDIVIVGGGIVGIIAALALADNGMSIAVVDAHKIAPLPESNKINLVINATSLKVLESIGLKDLMLSQACSIDKCTISASGHFGRVRINAADLNESELGRTIAVDTFRNRLIAKLQQCKNITCFNDCELQKISLSADGARELFCSNARIRTKLLVAADGHASMVRLLSNIGLCSENFDYEAILFHAKLDGPCDIATQRFLSPGSIALIPAVNDQACIIWTLPKTVVRSRLKLETRQLMSLAQYDLGKSAGRLLSIVSDVLSYPINMQRADKISTPGLVLLGPVANQVFPITAQGLNLAIRDIAVMREVLSDNPIWDESAVKRYDILRRDDHNANYQQVKYLLKIFGASNAGLNILRSLGFATLGASLPLARKIANIGFGNVECDFAARSLNM